MLGKRFTSYWRWARRNFSTELLKGGADLKKGKIAQLKYTKNLYKNWIFRKFKYARKEEFYAQLFVSVNLLDLVPEDNFTENCKPNSIYISFTKLLKSIMAKKDRRV